MKKQILSLDGAWELFHFPQRGSPVQTPDQLDDHLVLPAVVPGEAQLDLVRAKVLPEPYEDQNIRALRPYEFHEWWYRRRFACPPPREGERLVLRFAGVDCRADYYLDGVLFGQSDNALIEHEFDVTARLAVGEEHTLVVHIHSPVETAMERAGEAEPTERALEGGYEGLRLRRAPSSYGWDILCRCVTAGLWRSVTLERRGPHRAAQMYLTTRHISRSGEQVSARLRLHYVFETDALADGLSLRLEGFFGGEEDPAFTLDRPVWFVAGAEEFDVPDARLWWPAGYFEEGQDEAALYRVRLTLRRGAEVLCERWEPLGIRTLRLERTDVTTPQQPGNFCFSVNGTPILCKGSNWVPLDAFHSRDAARYDRALALFRESGCNMVRCWGGNVYEDTAFYDLCDRYGILVWQDFSFACARYPRQETFYEDCRREARRVILKFRQHPSLALWSGDNECDCMYTGMGSDPNRNLLTREVLRREAEGLDGERPYLPSSPYLSPDVIAGKGKPSEDHLWGPRDYYKGPFYLNADARFVSEMGYHGCPDRASLEEFLPPEALWPWRDNPAWITHASDFLGADGPYAYRVELMAKQIGELFGAVPEELDSFILASQLTQAEAKKFFIETARLRKWERAGILWWNMLDGWPQFSDAVVDWYFRKKLAYDFICRVQRPLCLMMTEPADWHCQLVAGNDSRRERAGHGRCWDAESGETLWEGDFRVPANENITLARIPVRASAQRLLLIEWEAGGEAGRNHYLAGPPPFDLRRIAALLLPWFGR
ncbi:MAG: hypothetical protein LBJ11_01435 [Oscillospiraceae bacterium]|jgi:beta-mannosidase|nr:hypothetical protein [Oscillospiraceae bacterium]